VLREERLNLDNDPRRWPGYVLSLSLAGSHPVPFVYPDLRHTDPVGDGAPTALPDPRNINANATTVGISHNSNKPERIKQSER
jgi:hypothetical protein